MKAFRLILVSLVALAAAVGLSGCGDSARPTSAVPVLDSTPPDTPTGLGVVPDGNSGRDGFGWSASAASDVASYEVYVYSPDPSRDNSYALAGTVPASQTSMMGPTVNTDTSVWFRVRAVDSSGNRSGFSAPAQAEFHVTGDANPPDPGDQRN